eukprot:TRINITY_DN68054_c0_g1_i1.p1 TRINITY_DN68054_c0_g1~~TRINITY_DN68054_c0_g1_i1.p1  ORF type:complete len:609 (-),score=114.28 TRINITY_DN68054_c0_g1_i1:304-2085(-)
MEDPSLGSPIRGVSVHHLETDLLHAMQAVGLERSAKIYEIEPKVIRPRGVDVLCPHTQKLGASYVDALEGLDHAGLSGYMLSYTWGYRTEDVVGALSQFCTQHTHAVTRTYVWICCFCINQHRVVEARKEGRDVPFEEFKASFGNRVRDIGHVLALMMPWDKPLYVTRVWCVFEIFTAISNSSNCELTVLMPPLQGRLLCECISSGGLKSQLWASLDNVHVEHAEASVAADRENILRLVEESVGSYHINKIARERLLHWFASASLAETQNLLLDGSLRGPPAVSSCSEIASLLHRMGLFQKALGLLQEAKVAAEGGLESRDGANFMRLMGLLQGEKSDAEAELESYSEATSILHNIGQFESHDGAAILTCTGSAYNNLGDFEAAVETYREAWRLRQAVSADRTLDGSDLLAMMGVAECRLGQIEQGVEHAKAAKSLRVELGAVETPQGAQILQQLGTCLRLNGDQAATEELERSKSILSKTGCLKTPQAVVLLKELARCKSLAGNAEDELALLREARSIAEDCGCLGGKMGVAVLLDLGSALLDARLDSEAKENLLLAERLCSELDLLETELGKLVKQRLRLADRSRSCCRLL